jgi:hypothetical protein
MDDYAELNAVSPPAFDEQPPHFDIFWQFLLRVAVMTAQLNEKSVQSGK